MEKHTDRFTLAAIVTAAILAAFLAASTLPTHPNLPTPLLTWAITYVGGVMGGAKIVHQPPGRTLIAATLMTLNALALLLTGLRYALDGMLQLLAGANTAGLHLLTTTSRKAA